MQAQLGDAFEAFVAALAQTPPVSIRQHPLKPAHLPAGWLRSPVPWCAEGLYLPQRPVFTLDPLHHAGAYYVQEASSMALHTAITTIQKAVAPQRVLDLCAAPGGKTTLLAAALPRALIVANETIRSRATILAENVTRWGMPNVIVTSADPEQFAPLAGFFDMVVVDAPCSGEGLWRKQPDAVLEWSESAVQLCAARQARIVQAATELVAPGGHIIYSTCTYGEAENTAQLRPLLAEGWQPVALPALQAAGFAPCVQGSQALGYQAYPHRVQGEGLFISVLTRTGGSVYSPLRFKNEGAFQAATPPPDMQHWLLPSTPWHYFLHSGMYTALPEAILPDAKQVSQHLKPLLPGTHLGEVKGRDLLPAHALAVSTARSTALPPHELTLPDALRFLKKESLSEIPTAAGWYLATYQGLGLGWLKAVPGRVNNYLPQGLRIRMALPAENITADEA